MATDVVIYGDIISNETLDHSQIQYVSSGGKTYNINITSGWAKQIVEEGGISYSSFITGPYNHYNRNFYPIQIIEAKGKTYSTTVKQYGLQDVNTDGIAYKTYVSNTAVQTVAGIASGAIIYSGGNQTIIDGGIARKTTVKNGGTITIDEGGIIENVTLSAYAIINGCQTHKKATLTGKHGYREGGFSVLAGGSATNLIIANNKHYIESKGKSFNETINSSGFQFVEDQGFAKSTKVNARGNQSIEAGGSAQNTIVYFQGAQDIKLGGKVTSTTVSSGGVQNVNGTAISTFVSSGGVQNVLSGGIASKISLRKGECVISSGGSAINITASFGGSIYVKDGGNIKSVKLTSGAKMNIDGGVLIAGSNSITNAAISGGNIDNRVKLVNGASLSIGENVDLNKLHLQTASANILITGNNNRLSSIDTSSTTKILYNISNVAATDTIEMISLGNLSSVFGNYSVITKKAQQIGTYELSTGLKLADKKSLTIQIGNSVLGSAKINSTSLTKNGVIYTLKSVGENAETNLILSLKAGSIKKGSNANDKLTGTSHSDIFYGGKGNDTITGSNGRDVAIYDTTKWGQDIIKKTNGTMTVLFNGIKSNSIISSLKGTTMTIVKKSDKNQKITIQGWNSETHNIVFSSGLSAFSTYLKKTAPTTSQTVAARNEVWQKAGLAHA